MVSAGGVQSQVLPGDGHNGKVYISAPPGFDEDPNYVYQLRRPLYGMPSAARAWRKRPPAKTVCLHSALCPFPVETLLWLDFQFSLNLHAILKLV